MIEKDAYIHGYRREYTSKRREKAGGKGGGGTNQKLQNKPKKKKKIVHTIKSIPSNLKTNCPQLVLIQRSIEDLYTKS